MSKMTRKRARIILFLILLFAFGFAVKDKPKAPLLTRPELIKTLPSLNSGVRVKRNIVWAVVDGERLTLDVFFPEEDGIYPMVVNIHGGGWTFGTKEMDEALCRYLAGRGYVIFNINYRLAPAHPFPAQVNDCLGAVMWSKDHSREYQADPNLVAVMGDSAGANLSAMVAFAYDYPEFKPTYRSETHNASAKAAVLIYGVYDMTRFYIPDTWGTPFAYSYLGGPPNFFPERYIKASPVRYISPEKNPAIMLVVGEKDTYFVDSVKFKEQIERLGIRYRFYTAKGVGHAFINLGFLKPTREAFEVIADFLDQELKGLKK